MRKNALYVSLIFKLCLSKINQNITCLLQINEKNCFSLTEILDDSKYDDIDLVISGGGGLRLSGEKFDLRRIIPLNRVFKPELNHENHMVALSFFQ